MIDYIYQGGWFMLPLLICSILLISIVIERFWFLQKRLVVPNGVLNNFVRLVKTEKIIEPRLPEIVFFGLMLVNLGPLNNLPKTIPPISEEIQINKTINKIILKWISFIPTIKININKNKYIAKKELEMNCL